MFETSKTKTLKAKVRALDTALFHLTEDRNEMHATLQCAEERIFQLEKESERRDAELHMLRQANRAALNRLQRLSEEVVAHECSTPWQRWPVGAPRADDAREALKQLAEESVARPPHEPVVTPEQAKGGPVSSVEPDAK